MSIQIRFRLSGDEEKIFLEAARRAGLAPDAYARVRALAAVSPGDALLSTLEQRLVALEAKLDAPRAARALDTAPATLLKGLDATELILAVRRETRAGVNAFLVLLDGEPLPEIPHRRTSSGNGDHQEG